MYAGRLEVFFSRTIEPFSRWKGAGAWNVVGSSAAGLKPCPFSVTTCSKHRPGNLPHHFQILLQLPHVVAVDRSDVAEAEILENHPAEQPGLQRVLHLREEAFDRLADDGHVGKQLLHLDLQAGVEVGGAEMIERFGQSAHARADRHLVVVEDDDEVLLEPAGVVHRLEDRAAGEGAVADDGHDVPLFIGPEQIVAAPHSQRGADAASGVTGHEQIVVALGRVGVAHQPALAPHRQEFVVPARHHFVGVDLVPGVPDQAVAAEIERRVQGERQLDYAQVRGEMGRARRRQSAEGLAHLDGQLFEFLVREPLEVFRRVDS